MEKEQLTSGSSSAHAHTHLSRPGLHARSILVCLAILVAGVHVLKLTWDNQGNQPDTNVIVSPSDLTSVVNRSPSDLVSFVRELRRHRGVSSFIERASSIPIVVMPTRSCKTGVGTLLQHYRTSLAYALALGLPWVGTMINDHDHMDYAEYLGLCQPFCNNYFATWDRVDVHVSTLDMDRCKMNGTFEVPPGLKRPTLIMIDDPCGRDAGHDRDEKHTHCLTGMRDRFMSTSMRSVVCTNNTFLTLHFRWGDTKTNDCNRPGAQGVNMSEAVEEIIRVRKLCPLQIKVMSEGAEVKDCFSNRFSGDFDFIDGVQSNTPYDLLTFACSTVLIGGKSHFSVLGALLMDGLVITPMAAVQKYESLRNIVAMPSAHTNDLAIGVRELAPCSQTQTTANE